MLTESLPRILSVQQTVVDNRYKILELLGSGGMAGVYLAHDEVLDRDVALKVVDQRSTGDREFVERFRQEARSVAALSHPNIVPVYDRGETEDGTYYIAMEYLPGGRSGSGYSGGGHSRRRRPSR